MERKESGAPNIKPPGEADTDLTSVIAPPETMDDSHSQSSGLSSYSSLFAKLFAKSASKDGGKETVNAEKKESKVPSVPEALDEATDFTQESVIVKAFGKVASTKEKLEIPDDHSDIPEDRSSHPMLGEDSSVKSLK
ncbi:unnamed protein product [Acanthoscelides obtectus]|uniref:Uncharacterized protein n=1 Tax=Acanthoscelides obtectus TaxID=200917 RepID=A0A9P0NXQ8_ACAOB|nr:unnamed protein product [Acanthoscelides obtectus]CAK1663985.1 hypothetical protein AOBTE_LOCUS23983 [Acanthoscelides obtectus]